MALRTTERKLRLRTEELKTRTANLKLLARARDEAERIAEQYYRKFEQLHSNSNVGPPPSGPSD